MGDSLSPIPAKLLLTTSVIDIGGRAWQITAVPNQDALLDGAEELEHFPFGFLLWEAAVGMTGLLAERPSLVAGKRVLELGAGVGVPGIMARSLGAEVWQTDHQAGALTLAERNAQQNDVDGITRFLADWRSWSHTARYDVILGADIMYDRTLYFYLERIFQQCLAHGGRLLLSDPGRPQALEFAAHLEKHGWYMDMETRRVQLDGQENRPVDVALWTAIRVL
jgi:predicted nicotinamide N-methyase